MVTCVWFYSIEFTQNICRFSLHSNQMQGPKKKKASSRRTRKNADPVTLDFSPAAFREPLLTWYRENARLLPWRKGHNPYGTWLSEIMLQQTRVATVIDRYRAFLHRFPTIAALAKAEESDVLALWSGLGYYRRARMLHRGAQFVERELNGEIPHTSTELRTLPGVGEYTAAAIASIAYGESIAVVDGNVERVLLRILGLPEQRTTTARKHLSQVAQALVPPKAKKDSPANPPGTHNQAMMELGATLCLPRQPLCLHCPVVDFCKTRGEHVTAGRAPQQSRMAAHLLSVRKRSITTEVLLERRAENASLMAGMLELPPLPVETVLDREPVLRLRHSITNTNYYVQIFSEAAANVPAEGKGKKKRRPSPGDEEDDELFVATGEEPSAYPSLRNEIPARAEALEWHPVTRLNELPLTGLTRKVLHRLKLLTLPKIQVD